MHSKSLSSKGLAIMQKPQAFTHIRERHYDEPAKEGAGLCFDISLCFTVLLGACNGIFKVSSMLMMRKCCSE